jgi:hypothetical protein
MPKKSGITIEEHRQLGQELFQIRESLVKLSADLSKAYPLKLASLATDAWQAVDALRSKLEDQVCRENPADDAAIDMYYHLPAKD